MTASKIKRVPNTVDDAWGFINSAWLDLADGFAEIFDGRDLVIRDDGVGGQIALPVNKDRETQ